MRNILFCILISKNSISFTTICGSICHNRNVTVIFKKTKLFLNQIIKYVLVFSCLLDNFVHLKVFRPRSIWYIFNLLWWLNMNLSIIFIHYDFECIFIDLFRFNANSYCKIMRWFNLAILCLNIAFLLLSELRSRDVFVRER